MHFWLGRSGRSAARAGYIESRGNGDAPGWFGAEFPKVDQIPDQFFSWTAADGRRFPVQRDPKDKDYFLCPNEVRYQKSDGYWYADLRLDESPQMRACMERRDVEYIRQLRSEGKLLEKEPNVDAEIKAAEDTPAEKDGWGHRHQFHDEIFAAFADAREEVKQFGKELSEKERQGALGAGAGPAPRVDHALGTDGIARISFSISYQELALVQPKIGGGGFGDVYRGTWNFAPVAVKVLHQQHLSPDVQSEFQREASLMVGLRHPNIIQLYGVCLEPGHYGMVMELMPKGSLFDVLHNADERLDWKIRWEIGMDVGQGLSVLHAQGILHRDLKSLNVLLDGNLRAKLTDFGLSRVKTESAASTKHQAAGTVRWMAPELFKRTAKYTEGSDIYSYGMILWELASRKTPYEDAANEAVVIQWIQNGETEIIPTDCPEVFGAVTKSCWAMEPTSRPKAAEVVTRLGAGLRQQGFFGAGAGADPGASAPAYDAKTAKPDASVMRYS